MWNVVTVQTESRRNSLRLEVGRIDFLAHPAVLARSRKTELGVRPVDRAGQTLRVTGPARTLVDSFRNPAHSGGLAVLDLELLWRVLAAYGEKGVVLATGDEAGGGDRAYRRETVVAEKVHAMVVLGSKSSRLRDLFDVQALAQREAFDGAALTTALRATFERRATPSQTGCPWR